MWLPHLLEGLNEKEMKSMGMKLNAEDIYSINKSSLKDAVVQFGGGCTGEIISQSGLLITNHHCGYFQIQSLSTITNNYLEDGFWAANGQDEIPCPGLTVTFIREIIDVTEQVLAGISDSLNEATRLSLIKSRSDSLEGAVTNNLHGMIRSFYHGNEYYLFKTEVFTDIRLVGAPPQSVGKFGGETDNWIWPRHTGDFSMFRIYADNENRPAEYSKENRPYTPGTFLTINIGGLAESDFAMVMGFPGKTNEYLLSPGLEMIADQTNPNRIEIREARITVLRNAMNENDTIRLQYAAKVNTLENAYKKWKGELVGFSKFNALEGKRASEEKFLDAIRKLPSLVQDTGIIWEYGNQIVKAKPLNAANDFFTEAFPGIELLSIAAKFKTLVTLCDSSITDENQIRSEADRLMHDLRIYYRNYNKSVDQEICNKMIAIAWQKMDKAYLPKQIADEGRRNRLEKYAREIFTHSLFVDSTQTLKFLEHFRKADGRKIKNDPAYGLALAIGELNRKLQRNLAVVNLELSRLQRIYMKDLLLIQEGRPLFPDANLTFRVSYGKIEGTNPRDGIHYNFYTTADGILEKNAMGIDDYEIPLRLDELFRKREFGRYGSNDSLHVGFLTSAHTTGGNSGSPVLNANGELIGVNFDRIWEGVLSDYYYDESYCRNVCLDIRYVLFLIDKYGNASRLIDEMKIVN